MTGHRVGFGRCEFDNLIADYPHLTVGVRQRLVFDHFVHGVIANAATVHGNWLAHTESELNNRQPECFAAQSPTDFSIREV